MLWTAQCVFVPLFTTGAYQSASVCRVGSAPLVPDQRTSPAIAIAHVLPLDANVAVLQKPDVVIAPIVFPVDMAVCPSTSVHVGVINRERPSPIVGFPPFGDEAIAESSSDAHDAVFVRVFALDVAVPEREEHSPPERGDALERSTHEGSYHTSDQ